MQKKPRKKGEVNPVTLRLDADTDAYFRRVANLRGVSLSEYLRQTLVQGVVTETVQEIEDRLISVLDKRGLTEQITDSSDSRESIKAPQSSALPDTVLLAIFNIEAMLRAIVEARDVQAAYRSQDEAQIKLSKLKAGA